MAQKLKVKQSSQDSFSICWVMCRIKQGRYSYVSGRGSVQAVQMLPELLESRASSGARGSREKQMQQVCKEITFILFTQTATLPGALTQLFVPSFLRTTQTLQLPRPRIPCCTMMGSPKRRHLSWTVIMLPSLEPSLPHGLKTNSMVEFHMHLLDSSNTQTKLIFSSALFSDSVTPITVFLV